MPPEAGLLLSVDDQSRTTGVEGEGGLAKALSPRERECLRLVAAGFKEAEIARSMEISLFTVRFHIGNACRKLNAPTRCAAIYRAAKSLII